MSNAATVEELREALGKMDHDDGTSWTTEGLPRVETVDDLLEGDLVTSRADITDAAPHFKRGESVVAEEAEEAEEAEDQVTSGTGGRERTRKELDLDIQEAEEELRENQKRLTEAKDFVADLERELDALKDLRTEKFPPLSPAAAVKMHLASELKHRMLRAGVTPSSDD